LAAFFAAKAQISHLRNLLKRRVFHLLRRFAGAGVIQVFPPFI
jgi:hypothetical protein